MAVGYPINKGVLDNKIGYLIVTLDNTFDGIEKYYAFLTHPEHTDAWFIEKFGYTQEDMNDLRAAVYALAKLSRVARGKAIVPDQDDFFFFADKLRALE